MQYKYGTVNLVNPDVVQSLSKYEQRGQLARLEQGKAISEIGFSLLEETADFSV
jgi:hypothetical protein